MAGLNGSPTNMYSGADQEGKAKEANVWGRRGVNMENMENLGAAVTGLETQRVHEQLSDQ
jgi:hypothetical protein